MAGQAIAEAFVDINARTKSFDNALSQTKTKLNGLNSAAKDFSISLSNIFSAGIVIAGLNLLRNGINNVVQALTDEDKALKKVESILKATGKAAGYTTKELKDFAQELQNTTTYSNDVILNTEAILATFKNIGGKTFKDATRAIIDMSYALDTDLKSSAIQVGKALNDPIKGITALTRVGVTFTDQQKNLIKSLAESGKTIEAQAIIIKELQSEFGGAAAAGRNTMGGAFEGLKNSLSDLGKQIARNFVGEGKMLVGVINKISFSIDELNKNMDETKDKTKGTTEQVSLLRHSFEALINSLRVLYEQFKIFGEIMLEPMKLLVKSFKVISDFFETGILNKFIIYRRAIVFLVDGLIVSLNKLGVVSDARFKEYTDNLIKIRDESRKVIRQLEDTMTKKHNPFYESETILGEIAKTYKVIAEDSKKLVTSSTAYSDKINTATGDVVAQGHAWDNIKEKMKAIYGTGFGSLQRIAEQNLGLGLKTATAGGLPSVEEYKAEQDKLARWAKEDRIEMEKLNLLKKIAEPKEKDNQVFF